MPVENFEEEENEDDGEDGENPFGEYLELEKMMNQQ